MSGTIPSALGKYEIKKVLGRGAMGIVYDGWDPVIHRRVAIKTVRLPEAHDTEATEALDRFKREAQAAGRLVHPNVVGVFDYGETAELAYIVMEFVEGRSLKEILDGGNRLPPAETVRVMADVLAGLAYSHGRGVIHRDIKPANVMITTEDQAKIADFGIARIEASSMTQAGTIMGTPAYMSPEQFMGQPVDNRTDLYSCGVMLYQLLAGERPFEGSMTSIMHKAMTTTPPAPSELAVTAPKTLDPVVSRAMARRPEDRFASAAEFAAALREHANRAAPPPDSDATIVAPRPQASPPPAPPDASPPIRQPKSSKTPVLIGGGVLLVAAAAFVLFVLRPFSQPTPSAPTVASTSTPATPQIASRQPATPSPEPAANAVTSPAPSQLPQATTTPASAPPTPRLAPMQPAAPAIVASPEPAPAASTPAPATAEAPAPAPAPQLQAAVTPPPVSLPAPPPSAASPPPTPVMASPPPNPATIPCTLVGPTSALTNAANESALQAATAGTSLRPVVVDGTFCPVLDALRPLGASALTLVQEGGPKPLYDREIIALQLTMPAFAGYLQVAYIQHDRTVATLVPSPTYPPRTYAARSAVPLGQRRQGSEGWEVGPPFGTDLIVALVTTAPLFAQPLPETQTLDAYLSTMQAAVDTLRRRGGSVAVAALPVDTRPAR